MRICVWSSVVCSSDLAGAAQIILPHRRRLVGMQPGDELRHGDGAAPRRHFHRAAQDRRGIGKLAHRFDAGVAAEHLLDRKSVVEGKSVYVRVDLGGRRIIKKKTISNRVHRSMMQDSEKTKL